MQMTNKSALKTITYILSIITLLITQSSSENPIKQIQKITTWNIGLEEIWAKERAPFIIEAIKQGNSDLMCIQELWGGTEKLLQVINETRNIYPYVATYLDSSVNASDYVNYYDRYKDVDTKACTSADITIQQIDDVISCYISGSAKPFEQSSGSTKPFEQSSGSAPANECVGGELSNECLLRCAEVVFIKMQNTVCWNCIVEQMYAYHADSENLFDAMTTCFIDPAYKWNLTLGLLVLSKVPLVLRERTLYSTFLIPRGYVLTEIIMDQELNVNVSNQELNFNINNSSSNNTLFLCTHLTVMSISIIPYIANFSTNYSSWDEENQGDSRAIVELLTSNKNKNKSQIIMADFNHGTNITSQNVSAVNIIAYNILANTGKWHNPYVERQLPCTACEDNIISPTDPQAIYDGILLTNDWYIKSRVTINNVTGVYREFDHWMDIWVDEDDKCINMPLSDHYAISIYFGDNFLDLQHNSIINISDPRCNVTSNSANSFINYFSGNSFIGICFVLYFVLN